MPGAEFFDVVECGGDGDCAYTSIAAGLADKSKEKPSPKDLRPGGDLQAQLRCWAAKEIRKHPEKYEAALPTPEAYALEVAKNGVWADSVSLMALARAVNVELRIWARRDDLPWQLYELKGSKKPTGTVWLVLEDYHYRLLRQKTKRAPPQSLRKDAIVLADEPMTSDDKWQRFAAGTPSRPPAEKKKREAGAEAEEPEQKRQAAARALDGGGGSRCGSVKSHAASTALSSARARRMLGLGPAAPSMGSAKARRLLGLASAAPTMPAESDEEAAGEPEYVRGQLYRCICGWVPSPELKSAAQHTQAKRHWRDCQGTGLPEATKEQRARARTFAGTSGSRSRWQRDKLNADQKAAQDAAGFEKWLKSVPKRAAKAACKPDFDHPVRMSSNGSQMYRCRGCQSERTVPKFRVAPCAQRPGKMKVSDWQLLALKRSPYLEKKNSGKAKAHDKAFRERRHGTEAWKEAKKTKAAKRKAWYWSLSERDRQSLLAKNLASKKNSAKKKMRKEAAKKKP